MAIALAMAVAFGAGAAVTAASVMEGMRAKFSSAKAIEAVFTIQGVDGPVQGSALMSGASFTFDTPQLAVWYDGKTQWTMLKSSGEVSITEPTPSELLASNPFAILDSYRDAYKVRRLSDSAGRYRVELVPSQAGTGIMKIIVCSDMKTKWPSVVEITFDDGRSIKLVVDSLTARSQVQPAVFRYDPAKNPATEIIDLR